MLTSKQLLNDLKKFITGSTFDDLLGVSRSLKQLSRVSAAKEAATFSELLKAIAPKDSKTNTLDYESLMTDLGVTSPSGIESQRLSRYKAYESMVEKISYLKRGLEVITQNVLAPDDLTKSSLSINIQKDLSESDSSVVNRTIDRILKKYQIENKLQEIISPALKYGDYFVEIVPVNEVLVKNKMISESEEIKGEAKINNENVDFNFILKYDKKALREDNSKTNSKKKESKESLDDFFLNLLNPSVVVRIGDNFCLGYFVFPIIQGGINSIPSTLDLTDASLNNTVNNIITKVKSKKLFQTNLDKTKNDLREVISKLLLAGYSKNGTSNIEARYVPPDRMVHFFPSQEKFKPYGTSIFYGLEFLSKILVAQESSLMVQRLMNAMEKRIIKVELGVTRDAKKYLQEFKETLRRKKFTVDNIGNIDEIPSNIATFEDMYVPVLNGRELVNIDTLPPRGDTNTSIEDIKHIRDSIVSGLNIPPAYLGLEENIESKATLSQENMIFANTILNYQKSLGSALTELVRKIADMTSSIDSKLFTIDFNPPRTILSQSKAEYISSIVDIIAKLTELGIPKEYILNKFLPEFNTEDIKRQGINDKIDSALGSEKSSGTTGGYNQI